MASRYTHFNWRPRKRIVLVGEESDLCELKQRFALPEHRAEVLACCSANDAIEVLQGIKFVDVVYCSMTGLSQSLLLSISQYCERAGISLCILPMILSTLKRKHSVSFEGTTMVLTPKAEPLASMWHRTCKRMVDVAVSLMFLFFVFPVVALVMGIIIKKKTRGPIFRIHRSVGVGGQCFKRYAFVTDDVMRPTFLDSLPEFISVLFGDMSLVGPEPMTEEQDAEYRVLYNRYSKRRWLKPGVMGWSQCLGLKASANDGLQQRVNADIWYAENWSLCQDFRIVIKSIF